MAANGKSLITGARHTGQRPLPASASREWGDPERPHRRPRAADDRRIGPRHGVAPEDWSLPMTVFAHPTASEALHLAALVARNSHSYPQAELRDRFRSKSARFR